MVYYFNHVLELGCLSQPPRSLTQMSHRQWAECSKRHNLRDKHTLKPHVHIWPVGTRWQPYMSEQGHCLASSA